MSGLAPDLIDSDGVWSENASIAWLPRDCYPTRGTARQRFLKAAHWWHVAWTDITVRARYVRLDPSRHPDEGQYVECSRSEAGATPVWRVELLPATDGQA